MNHIYTPQNRKMRVAFLFSGGATGMRTTYEDSAYDTQKYEIVCGVTNKPECKGALLTRELEIPLLDIDYRPFRERYSNLKERRRAYFTSVLDELKDHEPDVIFMSGFMMIVEDPLLSEFKNKIMNVHPAELSILTGTLVKRLDAGNSQSKYIQALMKENSLKSRYKGEDAVSDAIIKGEDHIKSTVHLAIEEYDEGPIIVQSKPFPVDRKFVNKRIDQGNWSAVVEYASKIQDVMKIDGDGPAIRKALE
ncbi:MAG: hypothetical protein KKC05_00470, partial [Nanoarchaeota archaeon]|nr:hypothetical protein [Nanoarchaeota archaeon]